jgi:hypothetical protein
VLTVLLELAVVVALALVEDLRVLLAALRVTERLAAQVVQVDLLSLRPLRYP